MLDFKEVGSGAGVFDPPVDHLPDETVFQPPHLVRLTKPEDAQRSELPAAIRAPWQSPGQARVEKRSIRFMSLRPGAFPFRLHPNAAPALCLVAFSRANQPEGLPAQADISPSGNPRVRANTTPAANPQ